MKQKEIDEIINQKILPAVRQLIKDLETEPSESSDFQDGELHKAPPAGTPLKCALGGGVMDHSGIYLGRGRVAELRRSDDDRGELVAVSLSDFLNGDIGEYELTPYRTGFRIYAACDAGSGTPLGSKNAAALARELTIDCPDRLFWKYDLATNNCHRFTAVCLGRGQEDGMWTLTRLERVISRTRNRGRKVEWIPVNPDTPGFRYAATPGKFAQNEAAKGAVKGAAIGVAGAAAADASIEAYRFLTNEI